MECSAVIRVCVIDDDWRALDEAVESLRYAPGVECTGAYNDCKLAELEIPKLLPDIVLIEANLQDDSGIACLRRLKHACPDVEFVMLTNSVDDTTIFDSLGAGAVGYVVKGCPEHELLSAIQMVYKGGSLLSRPISRKVVEQLRRLDKIGFDPEIEEVALDSNLR